MLSDHEGRRRKEGYWCTCIRSCSTLLLQRVKRAIMVESSAQCNFFKILIVGFTITHIPAQLLTFLDPYT
jgi:hypothetical protein